jgi:hypothetical protein
VRKINPYLIFQFAGKSAAPETTEPVQTEITEVAAVPEDISDFYAKMDKADEDDEEEAQTNTVSFEVNQVIFLYHAIAKLSKNIWFN